MEAATSIVVEELGIKEVTTKFGPKPTYSFKAGGAWFKNGFKKPNVAVGDTISVQYEAGTYGNEVKGITVVSKASSAPTIVATVPRNAAPAPSYSSKGVFPIPPLDGQRSIIRQNALTNAREMVCTVQQEYTSDKKALSDFDGRKRQHENLAEEIIRIARMFEAYSAGDLDAEEVAEEQAKAP